MARAGSRMLRGRCECRAVRYRVADEFLYAANCHCSNCRAGTGSAFKPFAGIERDKLRVVEGGDRLLVWGDDTANHTRCGVCGSLLYSVVRTAPTCTWRWDLSRTTRASARQSTSSSAQGHRGSRSRMTCLSRRSTRAAVPRGACRFSCHQGPKPSERFAEVAWGRCTFRLRARACARGRARLSRGATLPDSGLDAFSYVRACARDELGFSWERRSTRRPHTRDRCARCLPRKAVGTARTHRRHPTRIVRGRSKSSMNKRSRT